MDLNIQMPVARKDGGVSKKVVAGAGLLVVAGCCALNQMGYAAGYSFVQDATASKVSKSIDDIKEVLKEAKAGTLKDCTSSEISKKCGAEMMKKFDKIGTDASKDMDGKVSEVLEAKTTFVSALEKNTFPETSIKTDLTTKVKEVFGKLLGNLKNKGLNVAALTKAVCQDAIKADCTTKYDKTKCTTALELVVGKVEHAVAAAGHDLKAGGSETELAQATSCIAEMGNAKSESHSDKVKKWMDAMKKLLNANSGVSIYVWIAAGVGGVAVVGVLVYLYMMHMKKKKAGASAPVPM